MNLQNLAATLTLLVLVASSVASQTSPSESDPQLDEISAKLNQGDVASALRLLEALEIARGGLPDHLVGLKGALYVETGEPGQALETLRPLTQGGDADPAVLYNAGRAALALGDTERAVAWLEQSVQKAPDSPAARDLGVLWTQMGRFREAYRLLRPWASNAPQDTEAHLAAALCAVQLGRAAEAEDFLVNLDQEDPKVRMLWGKVLLDTADPYAAIAALEPLAEDPPPGIEIDLIRTLADAYATVGQAAEAVKLLEGRIAGNPSLALQLALAQYQSGDLAAATATLEPYATAALGQLSAADSPSAGVDASLRIIVEYGRLMATGGRAEEAIPYLEAATRLDPDRKQSWQQLGQAYAALGRREEAQTALAKFQEIVESEVPGAIEDLQLDTDVDDPTAGVLREATKAFYAGRSEEALTMLRQESELANGDPRPMLLAAQFLLISERADEALALADKLLQTYPNSADGYYIRGTILMGMRQFAEAEAAFQRALQISPEHTATMNDLAVLLMEQGRREEARALLERVLEIRPSDDLAAANLERLGLP